VKGPTLGSRSRHFIAGVAGSKSGRAREVSSDRPRGADRWRDPGPTRSIGNTLLYLLLTLNRLRVISGWPSRYFPAVPGLERSACA
jgi:hypothetical protein